MARAKITKIMGFPDTLMLKERGNAFESDNILGGVVVESLVPSEVIVILELPLSSCIKFENGDSRKIFGPIRVLEKREVSIGCRFVRTEEVPKVTEFKLTVLTEDIHAPHERGHKTHYIRFFDECG